MTWAKYLQNIVYDGTLILLSCGLKRVIFMQENAFWNTLGKIKEHMPEKFSWKRILYIACFAGLCMIDQIVGSATGFIQYGLRNYTGVIIGIIILSAYKIRDFKRIPYFVWAIVFLLTRTIVLLTVRDNGINVKMWSTSLWVVGIYGIIAIRMFYQFVIEKRRIRVYWPAFGLWFFMALWMMLARTDLSWPKGIFLYFLFFYLADFSKEGLNQLFIGMIDGILLGFLLIQGRAFLYRPYDVLRYEGAYSNANINALFYAFSYCAVLCKLYYAKLTRSRKSLRIVLLVFAGLLWGLAFLTGGRAALLTMAALTFLYILFQAISCQRKKWKMFFRSAAALVTAALVCLFPAYLLVRYIPAWVNSPIYFESDHEDNKIQEGDPVNSEKYIKFRDVLEMNMGRFFGVTKEEEIPPAENMVSGSWLDLLAPSLVVYASEWEDEYWYPDDEVYIEPGTDSRHPLLSEQYAENSIKIRQAIYSYFLKELNFTGHYKEAPSVWVTPNYCAPHTHNIILQMAYEFGIPVGIAFIAIIFMLANKIVLTLCEGGNGSTNYRLFVTSGFVTVFVLFGMVEISWIYGQLPFTMFFMMQYLLYHCKPRTRGKRIERH